MPDLISDVYGRFSQNGDLLGFSDQAGKPISLGGKKHEALRLFSADTIVVDASNIAYSGPSAGGYVDTLTTEVPCDADGFFVILANGSTAKKLTVAGVSFRVAGDMSQRPFNAAASVAGSFNGAAGITIDEAPSVDLARYVRSDNAYLSTVPRTDNPASKRRIVHVRVAYTAEAGDTTGTTKLSCWSRSGQRWTGTPRGFETYTFAEPGNLASNIGNAGIKDGASTIFGIGYMSRGRVRVVAVSGDSLVDGYNEGNQNRSSWVEGVIDAGQQSDVIDYMCIARVGNGSEKYTDRAISLLNLFKPWGLIHRAWTPNDGGAVSGTEDKQRQQLLRLIDYCEKNSINLAVSDSAPRTDPANTAPTWGASGAALMEAWDAELRGFGVPVFNFSSLTTLPGGRWRAEAMGDGVHIPESFGDSVLIGKVAEFVRSW